jgi:MraZ protein
VALFLSTFMNKVDRKGRVSVPSSFRSALSGQSFSGVVLFRSFKIEALEGSGIDRMQEMSARLDTLEQFSEEYESLATLFADARQLPFDGEGRIMLPDDLIEFTHITETVAFVGAGSTFQIWEPVAFEAHRQAMRERALRTGLTLPPRNPAGISQVSQ